MSGLSRALEGTHTRGQSHLPSISLWLSGLVVCSQLFLCQPVSAQELLASRQWSVNETAGHYDNRPQEVVFFLPGPGLIRTTEDVQPFLTCGRGGWQYFVAQWRKRGTPGWETGWPREATLAKRSCQDQIEGKPNRCEAIWKLSAGAENYQVRILLFPNHYSGQRTPAQGLSIAVSYEAGGRSGAGETATSRARESSTFSGSLPDISGLWDTTIPGTVKVMLDFQKAGSGWTVRFSGRNGWETMADLKFDPATGEISFRRPLGQFREPDQIYAAKLKGNTMTGTMDGGGGWTAVRKPAAGGPAR